MDVDAFEAAAAAAAGARDPAAYRAALALYAGDLLPEDRYADWAAARRERLRGVYLGLLGRLARLHETRGEYLQAAEVLRRALDAEPADEGAHAGLMRALALAGEPHQARRQFARLREALRRDLDAEPSPASRRLYEDLVAGRLPPPGDPGDPGDPGETIQATAVLPVPPATTPPAPAPPAPAPPGARVAPAPPGPPTDEVRESSGWAGTAARGASTLPAPLTSFIGRESELAAAQRALAGTRLLTLERPGRDRQDPPRPPGGGRRPPGVRGRRLAGRPGPRRGRRRRRAGHRRGPRRAGGARPAPPGDPRRGPPPHAAAARPRRLRAGGRGQRGRGRGPPAGRPPAAGAGHQPAGPGRDRGDGLARPPLRLPPRGPPEPRGGDDPAGPGPPAGGPPAGDDRGDRPEALLRYDAVRLFLARAQASWGAFRLTRQNAPALVAVCRRLDGLPLALELAAARVRVLSVEQLAARLDDRFRLLTGGSRTAPPRQQTLRATVAWSYDLLPPVERRLFERLAVFAGGWTLEAAERVCADAAPAGPAAPGPQAAGLDPAEVLDLLSQLVDKSLVVVEDEDGGGEVRYRLLETLRQYAGERLAASGEDGAVQRQHAACYLALAEAAEPRLEGPEQVRWLARLEQELDNLRAAHRWALRAGEFDLVLRLATALHAFWLQRHVAEGRAWLEACFARQPASPPTVLRARALAVAGVLASLQSEQAGGRARLEEALAMARGLGDAPATLAALQGLGGIARSQGDYAAAGACYREGLAVARELGDGRTAGRLLFLLGEMAGMRQDLGAWRALVAESVPLLRAAGDRWATGYAVRSLAYAAHHAKDYGAARALYAEALALGRAVGDQALVAWTHFGLGLTALAQANSAGAQQHLAAAVARFRERGERGALAHALAGFVGLAAARGDAARAVRLAGAAAGLRGGRRGDRAAGGGRPRGLAGARAARPRRRRRRRGLGGGGRDGAGAGHRVRSGGRPRGCPGSRLRAAPPDAMLLSRFQAPNHPARGSGASGGRLQQACHWRQTRRTT